MPGFALESQIKHQPQPQYVDDYEAPPPDPRVVEQVCEEAASASGGLQPAFSMMVPTDSS